jgi:Bacteriophage HK97-gp10, putative tail-component
MSAQVKFEYVNYAKFDRRQVRSAFGKAGRLVAREAKRQAAPQRRTGALWRSISGRASRRGYAYRVAALAPHAYLLELGTRYIEPQPVLTPVVAAQAGAVIDLLRAAVGDGFFGAPGAVGKPPAAVEAN